MQQPTSAKELTAHIGKTQTGRLLYVVFGISVAVTLVAIFALSAWAETSGWHHAVQHVLIFSSGFGAGGALLSLRKTKKEN